MSLDRKNAQAIVRTVLARGAGLNAFAWILVGMALLVVGALSIAFAVSRMSSEFGGNDVEKGMLAGVPLSLLGAYLFVIKGIRSFGARGTRVGRITLDFPERAEVRPILRRISVNGMPVRTAHLLSITVDGGDTLEIQVNAEEQRQVLEAFSVLCGPAAVDERILDMTNI